MRVIPLFLTLFILSECSGNTIFVRDKTTIKQINREVSCFQDTTSNVQIGDIISGKYENQFESQNSAKNTFPMLTSQLWFKFELTNLTSENIFLEVGEPSVNDIELYKVNANGTYQVKHAGYFSPYKDRDIRTNNYLFELQLPEDSTAIYFLHVSMRYKETITLPLSVGTMTSFFERNHRYDIVAGIFYGYMLLVVVFNVIMYFSSRDRSYLYFSLHAALATLWVANYYGHAFEFLWKNYPSINRFTPAITAMSSIFVILFSRIFLRTVDYAPRLHKGLYVLLGAFGLVILLNISDQYYLSLIIVEAGAFCMCVYLTAIALFVFSRGFTPAITYTLALMSFFSGIIIFLLQINGFLPANLLTRNTVPIGLGLEIGLISFAMGNRLRFYRREKKQTQVQLIASYEENQRLLINLREQELKSLSDALEVQEKERRRIAADLHDRLGSMLSTIKMYFSSIEESIKNSPDQKMDKYSKANSLLDEACEEVRRISHNLLSVELVKSGLVASLNHIVNDIEEAGSLKIKMLAIGMQNRLDTAVEISLFRVIQELINNILKHSRASEVMIQLNKTENNLNIVIEDNGVGFDEVHAKAKGGMGLKNIESRVANLNGKFYIDTGKGIGTTAIIDIPVD